MKREVQEVKPSRVATVKLTREEVEQAVNDWMVKHGHAVEKPIAQSIRAFERGSSESGADTFLIVTQELDPYARPQVVAKAA